MVPLTEGWPGPGAGRGLGLAGAGPGNSWHPSSALLPEEQAGHGRLAAARSSGGRQGKERTPAHTRWDQSSTCPLLNGLPGNQTKVRRRLGLAVGRGFRGSYPASEGRFSSEATGTD